MTEDSLVDAKGHLAEALEELVQVLEDPRALDGHRRGRPRRTWPKYLTIVKLRLENAIAVVRAMEPKG